MNEEKEKPDEFHGQGGSYILENGVRRRVESTEETAERKREPAPPAAPVAPRRPQER